MKLVRLKVIEGLTTMVAAIKRLAGRRTEVADQAGVRRPAQRTGHHHVATLARDARDIDGLLPGRRDAIALQGFTALLRHPVGGPGWRQLRFDAYIVDAMGLQRPPYVGLYFLHGWT